MPTNDKDALLRHARRRAETRDGFIAAALATYQALHNMDDTRLAETLGCSVGALPRLALCLRPDGQSPSFGGDVRRIAEYAGVNALALARLLRDVESTRGLRQVAESSPAGMLAAARDAGIPPAELREKPAQYGPTHPLEPDDDEPLEPPAAPDGAP